MSSPSEILSLSDLHLHLHRMSGLNRMTTISLTMMIKRSMSITRKRRDKKRMIGAKMSGIGVKMTLRRRKSKCEEEMVETE
jgi:hypothetical protein